MEDLRVAARVIEIDDDSVVMECVEVDKQNSTVSKYKLLKRIKKLVVEHIPELEVGSYIDIRFEKHPGRLMIYFEDGRNKYNHTFFDMNAITSIDDLMI